MVHKKKHQDTDSLNSTNSQSEFTNNAALEEFKNLRKIQPSADELIQGILSGNRTTLSRAITLIESSKPEHLQKANTIINACLPKANQSIRIGISGIPGVGKSTFIEAFGKHLTSIGKKVAVLTIDPSSTVSHG
ncbi:MAG TPA: hypothetical protein VJ780_06470, partial [Flavobacterium sp.]|nr:hypothetical protein [Flavobacterium sp.]